jgi:hypothetical protein
MILACAEHRAALRSKGTLRVVVHKNNKNSQQAARREPRDESRYENARRQQRQYVTNVTSPRGYDPRGPGPPAGPLPRRARI